MPIGSDCLFMQEIAASQPAIEGILKVEKGGWGLRVILSAIARFIRAFVQGQPLIDQLVSTRMPRLYRPFLLIRHLSATGTQGFARLRTCGEQVALRWHRKERSGEGDGDPKNQLWVTYGGRRLCADARRFGRELFSAKIPHPPRLTPSHALSHHERHACRSCGVRVSERIVNGMTFS